MTVKKKKVLKKRHTPTPQTHQGFTDVRPKHLMIETKEYETLLKQLLEAQRGSQIVVPKKQVAKTKEKPTLKPKKQTTLKPKLKLAPRKTLKK